MVYAETSTRSIGTVENIVDETKERRFTEGNLAFHPYRSSGGSARREEAVPHLAGGCEYHLHRIGISMQERREIRFRFFHVHVRRKRRHVRVRDHFDDGRSIGGERPVPRGADRVGVVPPDPAEPKKLRVFGVREIRKGL